MAVNTTRLERARDTLPRHLNAGILLGDGGFCVLGWMMVCAGFHEITIYSSFLAVLDPRNGRGQMQVECGVLWQRRPTYMVTACRASNRGVMTYHPRAS